LRVIQSCETFFSLRFLDNRNYEIIPGLEMVQNDSGTHEFSRLIFSEGIGFSSG